VVGNPGHPVRVEGRRPEGPDADWVHLPDPIADAIKTLASRISALEQADGNGDGGRGVGENGGEPGERVNPRVGPNPAGG
jgi:serine O-acetyltransferase